MKGAQHRPEKEQKGAQKLPQRAGIAQIEKASANTTSHRDGRKKEQQVVPCFDGLFGEQLPLSCWTVRLIAVQAQQPVMNEQRRRVNL